MKTAHRNASRAKRRYTADPMAMFKVIGGASNFTPDEQAQIQLPVRAAYDNLLHGPGCEGDFHTLASAVNVALVASERIDPLVEQGCIAARDALFRTKDRHTALGRWGFDGPAIAEIEQAVEIYEQLTTLLTARQVQDTMQEVLSRMRKQIREDAV